MRRWRGAALCLIPLLLCFALYWPGLTAWFQADDFAWLNLARSAQTPGDVARALFSPKAQGTFRVLSERAFFLAFYNLFGLDALPFHIFIFATQVANILLLISVARRLTGSPAAALWAAVFWVAGAALAVPMVWASAYNQLVCAFFFLTAFRLLLLFIDTGRQRYFWAQWAAFILGLGALELMVVYPAVAAAYTWVFARRHFRGTLPMLALSVVYSIANRYLAPRADGLYTMHLDASILPTALAYLKWVVGPGWIESAFKTHGVPIWAGTLLLTAALAAFVWKCARRGDWLPAFCLLWCAFLFAPYLPLRDHVTSYYVTMPSLALAVLGGYAMVQGWRPAAIAAAAVYLACSAPAAYAYAQFYAARSHRAENLVLGVARAAQLHPFKAILLTEVDAELFFVSILDNPFPLIGGPTVNLAPGTEQQIAAVPGIGDPAPWILPATATQRALNRSAVVVYSAAGPQLRNISSTYQVAQLPRATPRRLDAANPLLDYLLGSGWHESGGNHRFMGKRATVRLGGGKLLHLSGMCVEPVDVTVAVDGVNLPPRRVEKGDFALDYKLPPAAAGSESIEVAIEVSRTIRPSADGRDLGLAFGTFEVQ